MADEEEKPPHKPTAKQGMKHCHDDSDETYYPKRTCFERDPKSGLLRDPVSGLRKEDIYVMNDEEFVTKQHYTNIKQWFDLVNKKCGEQKVVIAEYEENVCSQWKDKMKMLIKKRDKYAMRIEEINEEIREIEKKINVDDESSGSDESIPAIEKDINDDDESKNNDKSIEYRTI